MKPNVFIIYHTVYGHIYKLAKCIESGVIQSGCAAFLYQVPQILPDAVLAKMKAAPKPRDPVINPCELKNGDGFLFGIPTRFGVVSAEMKSFFDTCGSLWSSNVLFGKPAGTFFSTATLANGQETTALSCIPFFTHLGMIYVPLGCQKDICANEVELRGGSPWGAGTLAGSRNHRELTETEKRLAQRQGELFGKVVKCLKCS